MEKNLVVESVEAYDIRFPTSLTLDGSDAVHTDPDYSMAYVVLTVTNCDQKGFGFSFTIGRGTEVVVSCIKSLAALVKGKELGEIFGDFRHFWRSLTCDSQFRWLGPEKGVVHLATSAISNALWDLWAKLERKPLWQLLVDMEPEKLVKTIDFSYISDCITPDEALEILKRNRKYKTDRVAKVLSVGIPAYITSVGWMGYTNEKIQALCEEAISAGWTRFKMKVGVTVEDDVRRAKLIRGLIGPQRTLMFDANQVWDVNESIAWMRQLAEFKPLWIEEPTSPDDILGHLAISKAMKPLGIGVATGEHCQNRVMFKQFLMSGAMQFCQIDSCRLGGVNEVISVMLMAAKLGVPICPHAGGVGLCELVQHLAIFNQICIADPTENSFVEFADHLHEHFIHPCQVVNGHYVAPKAPGYSSELLQSSMEAYQYPNGSVWKGLFSSGE